MSSRHGKAARRPFAAFDIDGTIARTGLFFLVVDELIASGHLPANLRAEIDEKFEVYRRRTRKEAFDDYTHASVEILINNLSKIPPSDFRAVVDTVIERNHPYTYVFTRQLIQSLKKQGYFLVALSGSENYTVQKYTEEFGFDLAIGDIYVEQNGRFTGEFHSFVSDKGTALSRIIAEHNLDLAGSIAVGDTRRDHKMLEIVDRPIAFNPDSGLFDIARERGWEIVVERKNVIYSLEPKDGSYLLA